MRFSYSQRSARGELRAKHHAASRRKQVVGHSGTTMPMMPALTLRPPTPRKTARRTGPGSERAARSAAW